MDKCTIIILGATGDLTCRKLLPALYRLFGKKKLQGCLIVGAARDKITSGAILQRARSFIIDPDQEVWDTMQGSFYYQELNFINEADYKTLDACVSHLEKKHGMNGNRLVYLASSANFFCVITKLLALSGLVSRKKEGNLPWNRIAYEKPFGHNLQSARDINQCIKHYFHEEQIYRVDHFLTKELVGNIALIRFTNIALEPLWNHTYIDNIQIVLSEEIGIENRGEYYDSYGALADVAQNHMLELLALIAMEAPQKLSGNYVREQRARVLENVHVVDGVLGQYKGYTKEKKVKLNSQTETFASLCLTVDTPRWTGVKFFLKTGKCLDRKETVIRIKFKHVACLLEREYCPSDSNYLIIQVSPDATFSLVLNAKKPGSAFEVFPINMEFCHGCVFGATVPDAYETLFEEIIKGEFSTSVSLQEIEAAWSIIDTVRAMKFKMHIYQCGSRGPKEAMQKFSNKYNVGWQL